MGRVFTSERCALHAPPGFPERPERREAVLAGASAAGWQLTEVDEHAASDAAVRAVHAPEYVERFERAVARGDGLLDSADNPLSAGSWSAAWAAVDCTLAAADWVRAAGGRQALAAVRPPGHHAERATAMGFCFFGNVAIAADYLVRLGGCERVAILDFDVHHGNGTQHLLEARPELFFASVHQHPFYPGTGAADERGLGDGVGTTLNVPLPAGSDDQSFKNAVGGQLLPPLEAFAPDLILVSAGFDGWQHDPLGGWQLSEEVFSWLGVELGSLAATVCEGRLLTVLEGGYSLDGLELLTRRYLQGVDLGGAAGAV